MSTQPGNVRERHWRWQGIAAFLGALAGFAAILIGIVVANYPYEEPHSRSLLRAELLVAVGGLVPIAGMLYAALTTYKARLFWWCTSVAALTYGIWADLCSRALN